MENCSTLISLINSLDEPSEKVIDVGGLFNEIDTSLQKVFRGIELDVNANLVQKTLMLIKDNQ